MVYKNRFILPSLSIEQNEVDWKVTIERLNYPNDFWYVNTKSAFM